MTVLEKKRLDRILAAMRSELEPIIKTKVELAMLHSRHCIIVRRGTLEVSEIKSGFEPGSTAQTFSDRLDVTIQNIRDRYQTIIEAEFAKPGRRELNVELAVLRSGIFG